MNSLHIKNHIGNNNQNFITYKLLLLLYTRPYLDFNRRIDTSLNNNNTLLSQDNIIKM